MDDNLNIHENITTCSSCVSIKIRDFPDIIGNTAISLINLPGNDNLNCTNTTLVVVVKMFEGTEVYFKVSFEDGKDECFFYLESIPLENYLSSIEMDQLLFTKLNEFNEIVSRIFLFIDNSQSKFTFGKYAYRSSISTAGLN